MTDTVKHREYSSVGALPGKSGSITLSPMPSASESVVARAYLHTNECHSTNQYKCIIVSSAFLLCLIFHICKLYNAVYFDSCGKLYVGVFQLSNQVTIAFVSCCILSTNV